MASIKNSVEFDKLFRSHRLPVMLQSEAAECGLVCLAMLCTYYGHRASLQEMRARFSNSLKGATLDAIMVMSDSVGLSGRPIRLELDELSDLKCPAILHWDLRHYVVLKSATKSRLVIHDPSRGLRNISYKEASHSFTGVALELTPTTTFEKKTRARRARLGELFGVTRGLKGSLALLLTLAIIAQAIALASPILNQIIVDDVLTRGDADLLGRIAFGMCGLLLINTGLSLLRGFIGLYMSTQLSYQMQTNMLRHVLRLPMVWFEKRHIGDIMSRFASLSPAQGVFTTSIISTIVDGAMLLFSITMMLVYTRTLTAIEVVTILFFLAVRFATYPWFREKSAQGLHLGAKVQSTFMETIRNATTFKLFGRESERIAVWQNEQAAQINNGVQVARFGLWGGAGAGVLAGLQQIIVWFMGAQLVLTGHLTLGMLLAFQAYTGQFTGAASRLIGQFFSFRALSVHLERLSDIVHSETEEPTDSVIRAPQSIVGSIGMDNVSFRYGDHDSWILKDINFQIKAGEFVCLIAPSGQGKTTLLKLLLGFYQPQTGEVTFDGRNARGVGVKTLRQCSGVVLQDDQLIAGSIADNISFFDPNTSMEDVESAAKQAQIHSDIVEMPMGYLTLVGDMGSTLSGGQRQRVFLARALYRKPKILFLDEGTANLDAENELQVMRAIRSLSITRICVAHSDIVMSLADRCLMVDSKQLRDLGSKERMEKTPLQL